MTHRPSPLDPRRVLHVLAAFDPREAQGRCVSTIAHHAAGEHHLLCGRAHDDGPELAGIVETGSSLHRFGWRDRAALARAVRQVDPDVIHFHGGPLGAATAAGGWNRGVPTVASVYAWTTVGRHTFGRGVGVRHLRTTPVLASRTIGNTVVPRTVLAAALRRGGIRAAITPDPAVRDVLADQAIPVGLFEGITEPQVVRRSTPIPGHFVFAGRAELTRGPDVLAAAVALLRSQGLEVSARFCFLGTADADAVARTAAVPGCTVTVGRTDLAAEMALATAVVLPFRYDEATLAPTMVATEAQALGVPVIGGDVRCLRSTVHHGRTGLLVPPSDVEALARAMAFYVHHPEHAVRMGEVAAAVTVHRWRRAGVAQLAEWAYRMATDAPGDAPGNGTLPAVDAASPPLADPVLSWPALAGAAPTPDRPAPDRPTEPFATSGRHR